MEKRIYRATLIDTERPELHRSYRFERKHTGRWRECVNHNVRDRLLSMAIVSGDQITLATRETMGLDDELCPVVRVTK